MVKEVPVIKEVIKEVRVEVPKIVHVPVEVIKEVPKEIIREVPREVIREVPRDVPVEVIKEVPVEVRQALSRPPILRRTHDDPHAREGLLRRVELVELLGQRLVLQLEAVWFVKG